MRFIRGSKKKLSRSLQREGREGARPLVRAIKELDALKAKTPVGRA
jgi:hypothetical protein